MKKNEKLFIVRKYVPAKDAATAIKNERSYPVNDVWLDDEWRRQQEIGKQIEGFKQNKNA